MLSSLCFFHVGHFLVETIICAQSFPRSVHRVSVIMPVRLIRCLDMLHSHRFVPRKRGCCGATPQQHGPGEHGGRPRGLTPSSGRRPRLGSPPPSTAHQRPSLKWRRWGHDPAAPAGRADPSHVEQPPPPPPLGASASTTHERGGRRRPRRCFVTPTGGCGAAGRP